MKKLLILSGKTKPGILHQIAGKLFLTESYIVDGNEAEGIISSVKPDYVLLDVIKPVNGADMMSTLRHLDGNIRLRVAIFYFGYSKRELFKLRHISTLPPVTSR